VSECPLRAHAQRNRDTLLAAARVAFPAADGTVSLEGIARDAGVGIGTLYRHFPTREALVEAVYAVELTAARNAGDPVAFVRANWALHRRIAEVSPSATLRSVYISLLELIQAHTRGSPAPEFSPCPSTSPRATCSTSSWSTQSRPASRTRPGG
jgi:AcrR family transcriptional regulator